MFLSQGASYLEELGGGIEKAWRYKYDVSGRMKFPYIDLMNYL